MKKVRHRSGLHILCHFFLLVLGTALPASRLLRNSRENELGNVVTFALIGKRGRLGNQLFQVASTIGVAESEKRVWAFPESISETSVGVLFGLRGNALLRGAQTIEVKEQDETDFKITLPVRQHGVAVSLNGYFQNWQTFQDSFDTIRKYLTLDDRLLNKVLEKVPEVSMENSVTLHVRRGDYVNTNNLYLLLDTQYYMNALASIPNVDVVIVVSDDSYWCRENLLLSTSARIVFSPFDDELSDFVLLYLGKHLITANSSYSWWAAFLKGLYSNWTHPGTIIAPERWYTSGGKLAKLNRRSFFPSSWILIKDGLDSTPQNPQAHPF